MPRWKTILRTCEGAVGHKGIPRWLPHPAVHTIPNKGRRNQKGLFVQSTKLTIEGGLGPISPSAFLHLI